MTDQMNQTEHDRPCPSKTNNLAVASMVLGFLWLFWIGSLLALIIGYTAMRQIKDSDGQQTGRGMAITGVVLGWLGIAGIALLVFLIVLASGNTG